MPNTLVVAYGASSRSIARLYSNGTYPVVLMDKTEFEDYGAPCESCIHLGEDVSNGFREVCRMMSGYSYAVLVFSASSVSNQEIYEEIIKCASNSKTKLIVFCTFPFSFESIRRDRALSFFADHGSDTGNVFVFDYQKAVKTGHSPDSYDLFLDSTNHLAAQILGVIVGLLETSPFFSYCSDPMYTMAVGTGHSLTESVNDALAHPFFDISLGCGKILVLSDRESDESEREQIIRQLSVRGNAMPEFAGYPGLGKDKVLLFIPTSFRRHG